MKRFKLDKKISKRLAALSMAGMILVTGLSGCSKKNSNDNESISSITTTIENDLYSKENNNESASSITTTVENDTYSKEKSLVNSMNESITSLFPEMNDEVAYNATLTLLLSELAKEDENGKISADVISNFKSRIDTNNIMTDFNTFLDALENGMIKEEKLISVSNILPEDLKDDKQILSIIEKITSNIINSNEKQEIVSNFDKIYTLFVEEDEIEVDGLKFEIRDLTYANRAVAGAYARTSAYYARNYITDEQYSKIDKRTNDQNNKAYIKTDWEILSNQMDEVSEVDIVKILDDKYAAFTNLLNGKISLSAGDEKDLVNYLNLRYLTSDKVATKDKRTILSDYDDSKISDTITAIDAITEYDYKNQNSAILFSSLLIDEYKNTSLGKVDTLALNFVQYNTYMLRNTVKEDATFTDVFNNPYFQNIHKYIMKQNVVYKYKDGNGNVVESTIVYQEVSDSVNLYCNEIINYTLNKLPKLEKLNSHLDMAKTNVEESIQDIQNKITDECEKVDFEDFVKVK